MCLHHFLPHDIDALVPSPAFTKDAAGGWTWGNHPRMSTDQTTCLHDTVRSMKHVFAYSNNDLPGYHGVEGPIRIPVQPGSRIYQQPRRQSFADRKVQDEVA